MAASSNAAGVAAGYSKLIEGLRDLGEGRISAMDAAGVDVQVLSLTFPGVEQLDAAEAVAFARETNDLLADAVRRHPDRFAGFAALPTAAAEAAAGTIAAPTAASLDYGVVVFPYLCKRL